MNNFDCRARISPRPHLAFGDRAFPDCRKPRSGWALPGTPDSKRCGGGGGDRQGGICGDLARRGDGGNPRVHVGRYDVPIAAAPLGDDRDRRPVAVSTTVRRMRWMPGTDPARARRSPKPKLFDWRCPVCLAFNHYWRTTCWRCGHTTYPAMDDPHLVSEGASSRIIREIASAAPSRARAWVFSTRHGLVRGSCSIEGVVPPSLETTGTAASCRAGKAQSRPARLAEVDCGNPGRTRGLRRASEAVVHARTS